MIPQHQNRMDVMTYSLFHPRGAYRLPGMMHLAPQIFRGHWALNENGVAAILKTCQIFINQDSQFLNILPEAL